MCFGAGLVGIASANDGHPTDIHACVNRWTGEVRIVSPRATCSRSEWPLSWGIQGPPGIQGLPGITGYEEKSHQEFLDPGFEGEISASCSPGKKVIGGGYDKEIDLVQLFSSEPAVAGNFVDNAWTVMVWNTDTQVRQVTVTAICATVVS